MSDQKEKISQVEKLARRYGLEETTVESLLQDKPNYEKVAGRKLTFEEVYDIEIDDPLPTPSTESD